MKAFFSVAVLAVLFAGACPCFAAWDIASVSKEQAKELGMEVRSERTGSNQVRVELEFKTEGELKNFTEDPWRNFGRVELIVGERDNPRITSSLREDRSKPGRIIVGFSADRTQLDELELRVWVPGTLGGTVYELQIKDFVETAIDAVDDTPKARGLLEGRRVRLPEKGAEAALGLLESCHDESSYQASERKNAEQGDHVRLVFAKPRTATIMGEKVAVFEFVVRLPLNTGVFWVRSGDKWRRYSKYEFEKEKPFVAWLREARPAN